MVVPKLLLAPVSASLNLSLSAIDDEPLNNVGEPLEPPPANSLSPIVVSNGTTMGLRELAGGGSM